MAALMAAMPSSQLVGVLAFMPITALTGNWNCWVMFPCVSLISLYGVLLRDVLDLDVRLVENDVLQVTASYRQEQVPSLCGRVVETSGTEALPPLVLGDPSLEAQDIFRHVCGLDPFLRVEIGDDG